MKASSLLVAGAAAWGIEANCTGVGQAHARVPVRLPSETIETYELELTDIGDGHVSVRERPEHRRLPAYCPERHINDDGSFCLYWKESIEESYPVRDAASAAQWWQLLSAFLERQETAGRLRRWFGEIRAHGSAAQQQSLAERLAATFGPRFARDLRVGALVVKRVERRSRRLLELSRGGRFLARVAPTAQGMIAHGIHCPCDTAPHQSIAACGNHREELKRFMVAMDQWQELERRFYADARRRGRRCCNTMLNCPLRDTRGNSL